MINLSYYLLKPMFSQEHFQFDTFQNFTFERKFCLFLKNIFRDIFDSLRRFSKSWPGIEGCFRALPWWRISLKVFANLSFSALKKMSTSKQEWNVYLNIMIVHLEVFQSMPCLMNIHRKLEHLRVRLNNRHCIFNSLPSAATKWQ